MGMISKGRISANFKWVIEGALDTNLHTWMPKGDGQNITINQGLSCMKVVVTKKH